jgi:hypothetical protein
MNILGKVTRWLGAYATAALAGYAIASVGITAHNLARLAALGIDIGIADAWGTIVFDFKALSPTFGTLTKYGSVVWLGYLLAFGTAQVLHVLVARRWRSKYLDVAVFALAGATAMMVGIAIIDAQYKVSMISGTGGVSGYLVQLFAGAMAGAIFALCIRASANPGVHA